MCFTLSFSAANSSAALTPYYMPLVLHGGTRFATLRTTNSSPGIEVLVGMELLAHDDLEDWRRGRVDYLERVIKCNLTRLSRLLRILRFHDLNLTPSATVYVRYGKGPKQRLRFTKTGDAKLELAYATHFAWPNKGSFRPVVSTTIRSDGQQRSLERGE